MHQVAIAYPVRRRDYYLVPRAHNGGQGRGNRVLGAVGDDHLIRAESESVYPLVSAGNGRAQLGDAAGGRIVRQAVLHGLVRSPADVLRSRKIRLA